MSRFFRFALAALLLLLPVAPALSQAVTTFNVNSTNDTVDANPGDGVCSTGLPGTLP
jgi:hypothetical protein